MGLEEYLKYLRVTQGVIAGVATSIGVESTARHAHEQEFNVTLGVDVMTDTNPDAHINSITGISPRLRNRHGREDHRSLRQHPCVAVCATHEFRHAGRPGHGSAAREQRQSRSSLALALTRWSPRQRPIMVGATGISMVGREV
jgi:Isochorismatase family